MELINTFLKNSEIHYEIAIAIASSLSNKNKEIVEIIKIYIAISAENLLNFLKPKIDEIVKEIIEKNLKNFNIVSFKKWIIINNKNNSTKK